MSELTREQVVGMCEDLGLVSEAMLLDFGKRLLAHDAALRAKLAQAHEHLEAQRQATYQAVAREHIAKQRVAELEQERDKAVCNMKSYQDLVDYANQQLAAAQAERDEAVRVAKALTEPAPVTEADVTWAQDSLSQVDIMTRQLAEADNEIARLKQEISQLLFFTPGGGGA